MEKILTVQDLTIDYLTMDGAIHAVNHLHFDLIKGKTLGLVGETGAGKTTTAKAIMRLLPKAYSKVLSGTILLEGEDILSLSQKRMEDIRGKKISMISQDPMTSLNPVMRVGDQVAEVIGLHQTKNKQEIRQKTREVLEKVGIKAERFSEYPHQFSGGMKQRVGIAMALACSPLVLIADEPTTALDVTIQAQVLELMKELRRQYNMSMIMITHDLGIVAEICDYVAVMYNGSIVEYGDKRQIFTNTQHPYTTGLFNCIPDLALDQDMLVPIKGAMPDPSQKPAGCSFAPRCDDAMPACFKSRPPAAATESGHTVACFKYANEAG
jgi:peptide/nickel transport system ATP-binding protein